MKKIKQLFFLSLLCGMVVLVSSCNKNDDIPDPDKEPGTEYTIMLYGVGGGNLDEAMQLNIAQALQVGANDRVKMTGQIKFSAEYQTDPDLQGTQRFILEDKNGDKKQDVSETLPISLPMYEPNTLADFIQWSKKQCPAENYILILWNHGGGWSPWDDKAKQSKGVIYDDNVNGLCMSLDELVAGVKKSDTHLKMIYYDACLMSMLENYCGLTEISDYALGAAHLTPGMGGDYSSLIDNLSDEPAFEWAIDQFCRETVARWNIKAGNYDLTLTDLSRLPAVTDALKNLSSELVQFYPTHKETCDLAADIVYRLYGGTNYFDVVDYASKLAVKTGSPALGNYASKLLRARDAAIVCSWTTKSLGSQEISWGITLINKELWASNGYEGPYQATAFDKATKWSSWLKVNEKQPTAYSDTPEDDAHADDDGE